MLMLSVHLLMENSTFLELQQRQCLIYTTNCNNKPKDTTVVRPRGTDVVLRGRQEKGELRGPDMSTNWRSNQHVEKNGGPDVTPVRLGLQAVCASHSGER